MNEFLWYIPNTVEPGHRGGDTTAGCAAEQVSATCLYTTPGKYGGGGAATTWLVGSAEDVATALKNYGKLGITHFVLSDTPYKSEISRIGDQLLPLLRK